MLSLVYPVSKDSASGSEDGPGETIILTVLHIPSCYFCSVVYIIIFFPIVLPKDTRVQKGFASEVVLNRKSIGSMLKRQLQHITVPFYSFLYTDRYLSAVFCDMYICIRLN